jgi:hypothetical protein
METFEMVYIGQRIGQKDKKIYGWLDLTDNQISYYSKTWVPASIGGVYTFTRPEGEPTKFFTSGQKGPRYTRKWEKKEDSLLWNVKDDEARQYFAMKQVQKKAAKDPNGEPLEGILYGIKKLSKDLTSTERLALVAKLTEAVFMR